MARRNPPVGVIRLDLKKHKRTLELLEGRTQDNKNVFTIPHKYPERKITAPKSLEVYFAFEYFDRVMLLSTEKGNDLSYVYASEITLDREISDIFDHIYFGPKMTERILRHHGFENHEGSRELKDLYHLGNTHPFRMF